MGQYWVIINEDKKEYIQPHTFGDGAKLMEFGCSTCGTLTGLTILLADNVTNGRGGGDFNGDGKDVLGRWHGDRIKIVGDYGDDGLWNKAYDKWEDISLKVLNVIIEDKWVKKHQEANSLTERLERYATDSN